MVFLCPYCGSKGVKTLFDDDISLRRHMSVCSHHPSSRFVSDYDEIASAGALAVFLGVVFVVAVAFVVWLVW